MRRFIPFILIVFIALITLMWVIPGCDELVTNEYYSYDTVTLRDSTCVALCHSDTNTDFAAAQRQWENSAHSSNALADSAILGVKAIDCGPECHTRGGFVKSVTDTSVGEIKNPFEIDCFACHAPHSNWNFSLRSDSAVTLISGQSFDFGKSNICTRCHRATINVNDYVFDSVVTDPFWESLIKHGSSEAEMIAGLGGYEFSDTITFEHSHDVVVSLGCTACHQDSTRGFKLGGHSLNITDDSEVLLGQCNKSGCHAANPANAEFVESNRSFVIDNRLAKLKNRLIQQGFLDSLGNLIMGRLIETADSAGALYNYYFVLNDKSAGMHNFAYDTLLLRLSIIALGGDIPPPKE